MRTTRLVTLCLIVALIASSIAPALAQLEDDIPDNCEYSYGAYYRPNLFPRYEPQNHRLLLVDWTTGQDVALLATDITDTLIQGWSASCRYLAVATGDYDSRDTVVYDTVEMHAVGSVPGAHAIPHPITWGLDDYLMVEGRSGAVLWNVPQNIQYPLDVGYNEITYHNFRHLTWDAATQRLAADLANGGRIVIDLTTGQQILVDAIRPGEIVLGGEVFSCIPKRGSQSGARIGYPSYLNLQYASDGGVIYLGRGWGGTKETLVTLEANTTPLGIGFGSWSINCRYIAGTLLSLTQEDSYDTVIWDVMERRRVGTFPDAYDVPYPLTWDTAETHVLIETRDGAYIWNLLTNERVLVNEVAEPPASCPRYSRCPPHSFTRVYWDAGREQMLGVPVQTPNAVVAYDVHTGVEATRYIVEGATEPLDFITSGDSRLLITYADGRVTVWDRETGEQRTLIPDTPVSYSYFSTDSSVSTDNHYLALSTARTVYVWDLTALATDGTPTHVYASSMTSSHVWPRLYFINGDTLVSDNPYTPTRLNVRTGEVFGIPSTFDPQAQTSQTYAAIPGTSGRGAPAAALQPQCDVAVHYRETTRELILYDGVTQQERVVEGNLNDFTQLLLSPDCRTIYGDVLLDNTDLPYDPAPSDLDDAGGYDRARQFIMWDAATGERIATLDSPPMWRRYNSYVIWSPDGSRAFARTNSGYYVIPPASRTVAPVRFQDTDRGSLPPRTDTYWDHTRGVVLVAGYGEVFAIDMTTGIERLRFPAREERRGGCYNSPTSGCGMEVSPDGAWVFVYGDFTMSAWNMDTLENVALPVDSPGRNIGGGLVSPDGHYLIISRSAVRVWDLWNLPESFNAREPIATYGVGANAVLSLRFVDGQTLEVVTRSDDATATTRYDVATGTPR